MPPAPQKRSIVVRGGISLIFERESLRSEKTSSSDALVFLIDYLDAQIGGATLAECSAQWPRAHPILWRRGVQARFMYRFDTVSRFGVAHASLVSCPENKPSLTTGSFVNPKVGDRESRSILPRSAAPV